METPVEYKPRTKIEFFCACGCEFSLYAHYDVVNCPICGNVLSEPQDDGYTIDYSAWWWSSGEGLSCKL